MKKSFLLLLIAIFLSISGFSQQTLTIGEGVSTTRECVLPGYYGYHYSAIMYSLEDLGGITSGASITSIAYEVATASTVTGSSIKVYLKEADELSNSSTWTELTQNATLVYDGQVGTITSDTWYTITFTTPYSYGGNNLIVFIEGTGCETDGGCGTYLKYTPSDNTYIILQDDTSPNTDYSIDNFATVRNYKPNTQITYTGGSSSICYSPKGLNVNSANYNSITFSWNAVDNTTGYEYQYKNPEQEWSNLTSADTYTTNDTSVTLSNLEENTSYDIRVRSICSDGNSIWKTLSTKTTCVFLTANDLPYYTDFENEENNTTPSCWTVLQSYVFTNYYKTYSYPYIYYNEYGYDLANSGEYFLYLSKGNTIAMNGYTGDISQLQLTFFSRVYTASDQDFLEIGIMTDLNDSTTYTPIDSIMTSEYVYSSSTGDYLYKESIVSFDNYTVSDDIETYYIVFKTVSYLYSNYWYLDDITLDLIPDCPKASNVTIDSLSPHKITVSWTQEGDNTNWIVYYKKANDTADYTQVEVSTTPTVTIEDLDDQTKYKLIIKTECGEKFPSSNILSFKTPCDVAVVDDANYWLEDFSDKAYCWSLPSANYYSWSITTNSIQAYTYATLEAISPVLNIENATTPYIRVTYSSKSSIKLYYRTLEQTDWTVLTTLDISSTKTMDSISLPNPSSYYQIKMQSIGINEYGYNIFYEVKVYNEENPSLCIKPYNLSTNSTSTSTALTWLQTGPTESWKVYYKEEGDIDYTASDELYEQSYTFSTTPNTTYNVYVVALCGSSESESPASSVTTFKTPCVGITDSDLPKTWDFESNELVLKNESYATYRLPSCWSNIGYYYHTYAIGNTSYTNVAYSGDTALYLHGNAYAILPPIDNTSLNMSTLQLSFYTKVYSNYEGSLTIGVMTNPNDTTTFTPITTINVPSSYDFYEIPLLYEGQDAAYIVLRGIYTLVDSLTLDYTPQCAQPSNLAVNNLNPNGFTLTWSQAGNASSWKVFYKESESEIYDSTAVLTEKTYTFSNLQTDKTYDVYVKSLCGDTSNAESKITTVHIPCVAITMETLPYTTDLEDEQESTIPSCWTAIETNKKYNGITYPSITTSDYNAKSGTKLLELYNECTIALKGYQGNITETQLSFYARPSYAYSYGGSLVVGILTDLSDASTFTPIDTFIATSWSSSDTDYELIDVSFDSYTTDENITTYYIAMKTVGVSYSSWYVDDITILEKYSCPKATNITFNNLTSTSVDVSWTQSDENTSWIVYYKKFSDTTYSQLEVSDSSSTELTNLEPATKYDLYIVTQCGDNNPITAIHNFRTSCPQENMTITAENIYEEDFESYSKNEMPSCWTSVKAPYSYPMGVKVENAYYNDYAYSGKKGFCMIASETCPKPIVALREFSNDLTDLRIEFYYKAESAQSGNLEIGYITDVTNSETFVSLYSIGNNLEWTYFMVDMNAFENELSEAENPRLALRQNTSITNSWFEFKIDSLVISLSPACATPSNVVISSVLDTTTISWYSNVSSFDLYIKDAQGNIVVQENDYTDNTYTTTALNYNTTYTLSITSICSDGSTATPYTETFTTACSMLFADDLPISWDFESDFYTVGYYDYPSCWTITGSYPTISSYWDMGTDALYFPDYGGGNLFATLPEADTSLAINSLQLTFEAYNDMYTSGNTTLSIGVMTDPTDVSTFTAIKPISLTYNITSYTVSLATYQGEGKYIAFFVASGGCFVDNITLEKIPACKKATNVNVSNITTESATISWIQSDTSVSSWIVNYRTVGATQWDTIQTDSTSVTLTNLQESTTYEARIEGVCDLGDNPLSATITFKTSCSSILVTNTTPWEASFSSEDDVSCWTLASSWTLYGGKLYHSYSSSQTTDDAITPIFDLSAVTAPAVTLTYTLKDYMSSNIVNTLTVLYRANSTDNWTELKSYNTLVTDAVDTIDLPNKSATYQLNLRWSDYNVNADGIIVSALKIFNNSSDTTTPTAPCDAPTSLTTSNITQTTATVSWVGTASSYDVQLNNNTVENVTTTSKQFSDLTANTTYTVKVRSNCGTTTSDWVTTTFTTLEDTPAPCNAPTNLEVIPTSNSLTLSWTGDAAAYDVQINDETVQTTQQTIFTFANLTPSTTYSLKVRSNCGNEVSDWATITGTTNPESTGDEDPVVTTNNATVGETTATLNAVINTNGNTITKSGFKYRELGANEWTNDVEATLQSSGLMSIEIDGLTPNTDYEYKAYVITSEGNTFEGSVKAFKTLPSGLTDVENSVNILTYPNPTTTNATLEINGLTEDANIILTDVNGRVVFKDIYSVNQSSITISTESLSAGVYYIRVTNANFTKTQTLIKK